MIEQQWHDAIAELRLANPPVNALGPELVSALRARLDQCREEGARAIILSGRPGLFSAGLDLPSLMQLGYADMRAFWVDFFGLLEDVAAYPVPTVAALTGHSPAGGTVIALFCDYRVMARGEFQVGLNETQIGLIVPEVIRKALVRQMGAAAAERHLVAGRLLAPEAARAGGLVDALADPEATVEHALEWCRHHLGLPEHAMLENRRRSRRDLVELFEDRDNLDPDTLTAAWFREETQAALRQALAKLGK